MKLSFIALAVVTAIVGVGSPSATPSAVATPPVNAQFDYQLGGAYQPSPTVGIVDRDRGAPAASGTYSICYLNAFQTQPGEASFWAGQHRELLLKDADGDYATDPDWPGEYILDTTTAAKRSSIAAIVNGWMDGCKAKGYSAVEPDNLDTYTRFDRLSRAGNLALARLLSKHAHEIGLAIAQKNTADIGSAGAAIFDFAIAEECQVYDECDAYTDVYGDRVIEIEYTDNPRSAYREACAAQGKTISVILRDRDVVPRGQKAYRYERC